jgi:hypothetical protein
MRINIHTPCEQFRDGCRECTGMAVTVEPLGNDRFALMIDGLVRFVSYDFGACVQRAETILRSKMSTKARDDQALLTAIHR